jgi:hypothetical protein
VKRNNKEEILQVIMKNMQGKNLLAGGRKERV